MAEINERELTIWMPAWGDHHLAMLENFGLPSLMQPGNLPSCGYSKIYVDCPTRTEDIGRFEKIVLDGMAGLPVEFKRQNPALDGLRETVLNSKYRGTRFLTALPDFVFGNGSVGNLVAYARGKNVCVAGPHLRVNEEDFREHFVGKFKRATNAELVFLTMRYMHNNTRDFFTDRPNASNFGGVAITHLSNGAYAMIHHLPNIFLAWITDSDADYFKSCTDRDAYDHDWPKLPVLEGRYRMIGASDLFYMAELTGRETHGLGATALDNSETCRVGKLHFKVSHNFVISLRT